MAIRPLLALLPAVALAAEPAGPAFVLQVAAGEAATVDGVADEPAWSAAEPIRLQRMGDGAHPEELATTVRAYRSAAALHLFFDCADRRLTSTGLADWAPLYHEDVVEAFIRPDDRQPAYLEYQASPLEAQVCVLALNNGRAISTWRRWREDRPASRVAVRVRGGERAAGADVAGWTAEIAIPWDAMAGLEGVPPADGDTWRANFFRIDYDDAEPRFLAWTAFADPNFHDTTRFGTLVFGQPAGQPAGRPSDSD